MNNFPQFLNNYTENKNVCILGFGREGRSTYRMLSNYCQCASVTIADLNNIDRTANDLPDSVKLICGENYQDSLDSFDIVFKSPGIVLKKSPSELDCEISSETQVFFSCFREQIIGITGTKGKSTVSSLIYHILRESGKDAFLAGNIGIPVFDIAEKLTDDSIVVCELSCHQLEYMTVSPSKAVFLNLYEEHLDHYGTLENYYNAKKNIYLHQHENDTLLISSELAPNGMKQNIITVSNSDESADVFVSGGKIMNNYSHTDFTIPADRIRLLGIHNHYNIAAAFFITSEYVTPEQFEAAVCSFDPLAHRLEYVTTVNGVRYYDDSISTACATAVEALKSVPDAGTILIGGMDRGIDYTPLVQFLSSFDVNVICMEASGKRVYDMICNTIFSHPERVHCVEHLEDAVKLASEITPSGKSCVLSPAAASYGIFKNFEERGDAFKSLVRALQ